jgi:ABC-type dipeptide/oligopeptide/nickel transport system permease subunit
MSATLDVTEATGAEARGADHAPPAPSRRLLASPLLVVGLAIVGLLVLVAIFAPLLTPYNPQVVSGPALHQPFGRHWLGTDVPGRDIFAQLVYGARASLIVAVTAASLAMLGAILLGVVPVLRRGFADAASHRLMVFLLALPGFPLLIVIGALAGNHQTVLTLVIAYVGIAPSARLLRGQALALRDRGFIGAARGFGGGPVYVVRRHIVPAMGPLVVVGFVNWAASAVGLQAALAFLGLGSPDSVSWGEMLNRALSQQSIYTSSMWKWWVLPPGLAITLTLVAFTFIGVGLEPWFNPRSARSS